MKLYKMLIWAQPRCQERWIFDIRRLFSRSEMFEMWLEINISIFINMLSDLRLNFQLESDPSLHFIYLSHCVRHA